MSRKERILERLAEAGAEGPKRSLGQNFLISDTVVDKILFAAKSEKFPALVEVGPGLGAITEDLLSLGKPLAVIELDRNFATYWRKRADGESRLRVVEADALQTDWRELALEPGTLFVSNLPYQISSSLVIERSLEPAGVSRMILMFQKEVAQRLKAQPATKEYGLLTVIAQAVWEISTVCDASPRDFYPSPNVASRVLMFRKKREALWPETASATMSGFLAFVKAAFSHRRKLMAGNLDGAVIGEGRTLERASVERVMAAQGLKVTARAEELDPAAFVRLYLACGQNP